MRPRYSVLPSAPTTAASGAVFAPHDCEIEVGGHSFAHWLSMGFASGAKLEPMAVPFPFLYSDTGFFIEGVAGFLQWGQPFYWQHFEALVPHIIRLRCSSLYRIKESHRATLAEIFGSGPASIVDLRVDMTVVTCLQQWLVKRSGNVKTLAQQLKVNTCEMVIKTTTAGALEFGSRGHVFAAADGNVHFDGHLRFQTEDGRSVVVFYQVKHTQLKADKNLAHVLWKDVDAWLRDARAFTHGFKCDVRLYVVITNKEVRDIPPAAFPPDLVLIHQGNLGTFFAPCFMSSARLAAQGI